MLSNATVLAMRADLPSVTSRLYLNTGTFGPLPSVTREAMRQHLDWATKSGRIGSAGLERWHELEADARAALATALGCRPEQLALTHSTTDGVNTVLAGLPWQAGDEVVTGSVEHPGLIDPLAHLAETRGVVVRTVGTTDGRAVDSVTAALTERTRLVACSHVLWSTGEVLDLAGILAAAGARDIPVLADGAQGAGAIPVDLTALGCDFYTVSGQKWLCGPSGTGALYVRPDRVDTLVPAWRSYVTNDRTPGTRGDKPWPGARRYDVGAISLVALAGLTSSLRWRLGHGMAAACAQAADVAARLRTRLADVPGLDVADPGGPTPFAAVALPAAVPPERVVARLEADGIFARWIPGTPPMLRASVGPWNTDEECERFVDSVRGLVR
ncbi:MAG: aminotransferase class V-fold PLP-dependent enzyme [Geodermatophilaceae bacterium]